MDETIQFIERLQESFIDPNKFREILNDKEAISPFLTHWSRSFTKDELTFISEMYNRYERIKRANNKFDYEDILSFSYKILKQNVSFRRSIQKEFEFILVDEFQDIDNNI